MTTTSTSRDAVFTELLLGGMPEDRARRYAHCGATPAEAREAEHLNVPFTEYTAARHIRVSHAEIVVVHLLGGRGAVVRYTRARQAGKSHDRAFTAVEVPSAIGVPVLDLYAAHQAGCDLSRYVWSRRVGATHTEILDAHRAGCHLGRYSVARQAGVSHDEVLDAHRSGCDLYWYVDARRAGVTHSESVTRTRC